MEDTESSDFQSSYDSLYSVGSGTSDREDANYVDFDVFLSDGMEEASKTEEDYDNDIPNSRLTSTDHPVLIRLENEYQARRSLWHKRAGQYSMYPSEIAGRISCTTQANLTGRGSPLSRKEVGQKKISVCSEEANLEAPHGPKRQRTREAQLSTDWWKQRQEQDISKSEGDRIFARKCRELQGFIKPLTDLLNGLKKGRYDRGLSSFQQSVAMDRIQRIVGVLQKPEMGERYLGTLLQVEMMLKIWFPGVTSSSSSSSSSDYEAEEPQCKLAKHPSSSCEAVKTCPLKPFTSPSSPSAQKKTEPSASPKMDTNCVCCKERMQVLADLPAMNLTWMHTAPICNPPLSQANLHPIRNAGQDLLAPSSNSCSVILFLHNNLATSSTLPRSNSTTLVEKLPPVMACHHRVAITGAERPLCSRSAPATMPFYNNFGMLGSGDKSPTLSQLPTCTHRPAGEKT
ncbi:circadian-associated transcriptional repressor [Rhinophrynus dorsalis]